VARQLDDMSDADPTGRAQELAREARALPRRSIKGRWIPATQARQEQLLRRMLDAGRSLEQDQRDESQRARRAPRASPRASRRRTRERRCRGAVSRAHVGGTARAQPGGPSFGD
jgi:hypothetical protein